MKKPIFFILILVTLVHFTGCSFYAPSMQQNINLVKKPNIEILSKEQLITTLNNNFKKINTIKASGEIHLSEPNYEEMSCQIKMFFSLPDSIYIKGYKPLIPNIFRLINHNKLFYFFIPDENVIFTGNTSTLENNNNYNINIKPNYIKKSIKPQPITLNYPTQLKITDKHYVLSIFSIENQQSLIRSLTIDKETLFIIKELFYSPKGYQILEITRKNFKLISKKTTPYAFNINILNTIKQTNINLKLNRVELNEEINKDIFEFVFPKGVDVEEIT